MQIFNIISISVPLILAIGVPYFLRRNHFKAENKYHWLLYAACSLFFVSWYLPSPLIDGQDTSFTTHFVGGGVFSGLLWLYLKFSMKWRSGWLAEAFSLFALVSALGCVNELAELFMVKINVANITLTDTNWDILANTMGAAAVFIVYFLAKHAAKI